MPDPYVMLFKTILNSHTESVVRSNCGIALNFVAVMQCYH